MGAYNVFVTADPHFGHKNLAEVFTLEDRVTPARPFTSVEEMDETLVDRWNAVVRQTDKVYLLGDVAMGRPAIATLARLNGTKVLVRGNHDTHRLKDYAPYVKDVRACHVLSGLLLTHIPVHPATLRRFGVNVHGHEHHNLVREDGSIARVSDVPEDLRYLNVSVEQTNYTPVAWEVICERVRQRGTYPESWVQRGPAR
jgi:calcineurin-like phosphoesterase family protein